MAHELASEPVSPFVASTGLSQAERVVDTYIAPTKTFADILRSASWWLPFLLLVVFSVGVTQAVQRQVGFDRVVENQIHESPKQEERLSQLAPDQRARQVAIQTTVTRAISYAYPVVVLLSLAIYALILWGSFNFGLGATTTFPQVFAVTVYSGLPYLFKSILMLAVLLLGHDADSFNIKNPVGTNPAYFLSDAAPWLKALLQRFDLLDFWSLALVTLGMAIIARKKVSQAAVVTISLWVVMTLLAVAGGAFS